MRASSPDRRRRRIVGTAAVFVVILLSGVTAALVSPWPGVLLVRWMSAGGSEATHAQLDRHAPSGIVSILDQSYRDGDDDAQLDVYYPSESTSALPTVVWVHGGGWIAGSKTDTDGYYKLLADQGFTVISVDYSLGPDAYYPTAVNQLNDAYRFIVSNADRLHVDSNNLFLAGDSAGAQLSSQLATVMTSPDYASEMGVEPALRPEQIRGVVLDCGVFDLKPLLSQGKYFGWGVDKQSLWGYLGTRDFDGSTAVGQMSTLGHVTSDFPATFITGGNVDPLTASQSKPMAERLADLGVEVDALFYPDDHEPALDHEYQFDLDTVDGMVAFDRTVAFLRDHVR